MEGTGTGRGGGGTDVERRQGSAHERRGCLNEGGDAESQQKWVDLTLVSEVIVLKCQLFAASPPALPVVSG